MPKDRALDAVIIGGGHNGLTCACYPRCGRSPCKSPGKKGRGRRGCSDRGVPPGVPQFHGQLHGQPPESQGDPRPPPGGAWAQDSREAHVQSAAPAQWRCAASACKRRGVPSRGHTVLPAGCGTAPGIRRNGRAGGRPGFERSFSRLRPPRLAGSPTSGRP